MTNQTPRDSAQLPPLPQGTEFHSMDKDPASDGFMPFKVSPLKTWFTADQMQAYAREALRAQSASVEPQPFDVRCDACDGNGLDRKDNNYGCSECQGSGFVTALLYAGAPPAHIPADVEESLEAYSRHLDGASSPATAVDAVDDLVLNAIDSCIVVGNPCSVDWNKGVSAAWHAANEALQASRQPQAQQAVAEGAGEVIGWGLIASNTGKVCRLTMDHDDIEGMKPEHVVPLVAALATKEQRS